MSFFDVKNSAFEAFNYPMSWLELVATAAGLFGVWLSAREHISNWAIGLVNITLSAFVFYQYQLYSDMLLQFYFFATGIYGWWQWNRRGVLSEKVLKVSFLSREKQLKIAVIIALGTLVFGSLIGKFHEWLPTIFNQPASFPYADTLIMMMSLFGNLLLALKKIEAWVTLGCC
ncbi:MAG: nicotinamide mononucleotide transporter [Saprospiraceae bacterium]|nr:nicotinamide mononucleotide transporter [Saprospiraceae bacterium]